MCWISLAASNRVALFHFFFNVGKTAYPASCIIISFNIIATSSTESL